MKSFINWLKESAVPQTVDLTDGGRNDQGITYWGAMPKIGEVELSRRSKRRKKKIKP